jgi:hypothetical protein
VALRTRRRQPAFVNSGKVNFNNPKAVFASNARTIGLMAKFDFQIKIRVREARLGSFFVLIGGG